MKAVAAVGSGSVHRGLILLDTIQEAVRLQPVCSSYTRLYNLLRCSDFELAENETILCLAMAIVRGGIARGISLEGKGELVLIKDETFIPSLEKTLQRIMTKKSPSDLAALAMIDKIIHPKRSAEAEAQETSTKKPSPDASAAGTVAGWGGKPRPHCWKFNQPKGCQDTKCGREHRLVECTFHNAGACKRSAEECHFFHKP